MIYSFQQSYHRISSLDRCRDLFLRLISDYPNEYKLYELDSIAVSSVLPLIKAHFKNWEPLDPEQVKYGFDVLKEWKEILKQTHSSISMFDHFKNNEKSWFI